MGSHSVTFHPAAVTFPLLLQPKLVLELATLEGCKAEQLCTITSQSDGEQSLIHAGQCMRQHALIGDQHSATVLQKLISYND